MDRLGSWGTDLEMFFSTAHTTAHILGTDIFVYKNKSKCWMKFSGYGLNDKHSSHNLTETRIEIV